MNELNDSYQAFGVLLGTIDRDRSVTLTTMPALPGNSLRLGVDPGWNRAHPNRGCRSWGLKPPVSSRLRAM
ncbi:Hypothetical protein PFR_JS7-2_2052 [Propionibacterium freudenreichii]|nr:Hypothetical protein PFR_JS7-1_2109 [Propionibacterium freudenreichii]SCQ54941.1 Hypothetical protein PFR_JS7-2_2052 [Propionibacterium freudenreichii]